MRADYNQPAILPRDEIRPSIRELSTPTLQDVFRATVREGHEEDRRFIRECASEIYWRDKANPRGRWGQEVNQEGG